MSLLEQFYYRRRMERRHSKEEIENLLTDRQKEILTLAAKGLNNSEIAKLLGIASWTVHNHFRRRGESQGILGRLDVFSRKKAVVKAIWLRIINTDDLVSEEEIKKLEQLTEQEREILSHLASPPFSSQKKMYAEITEKMDEVTPFIVQECLTSIYKKLGIKSSGYKNTRAAVIYLAFEQRKLTSPFHERFREQSEIED